MAKNYNFNDFKIQEAQQTSSRINTKKDITT